MNYTPANYSPAGGYSGANQYTQYPPGFNPAGATQGFIGNNYVGDTAQAPPGVTPLAPGVFILPNFVDPNLAYVNTVSGRADATRYNPYTGKMETPQIKEDYTGVTYTDTSKLDMFGRGTDKFIPRSQLEQLKKDYYAGQAKDMQVASGLKSVLNNPDVVGMSTPTGYTYFPIKPLQSLVTTKPEQLQISSRPIATASNIAAMETAPLPKPNFSFEDLNAYFFPYTGKTLITTVNTPTGYNQTITKYGNVTQAIPPKPFIPTFKSGAEAAAERVREIDNRTASGFKDFFSEMGLTSEQFAARAQLARALGTPPGALVPGKDFGRSMETKPSDLTERLEEAGKGALFYTTAPITLGADVLRATLGRTALFTVQAARGQGAEAYKTLSETPAAIGGTIAFAGAGAVGAIKEAVGGSPAAVGGLILIPGTHFAIGEFAKGAPVRATFAERVNVLKSETIADGIKYSGEIQNVAKAGGREVATVETFNNIVFNKREIAPTDTVTFQGQKYRARDELIATQAPAPKPLNPDVQGTVTTEGFQQLIKPEMTKAGERLGLDYSRTMKGVYAEKVEPVSSTGITLTPEAAANLEAKLQPQSVKAAYALERAINNLNPPAAVSNVLRDITLGTELQARGGLISTGEGALSGGAAIGKVGGKEFASVGVSRFETANPSFAEGTLQQSYVGQTRLTKGGEASATGRGVLILSPEVAMEVVKGSPELTRRFERINRLLDDRTAQDVAYNQEMGKVFNEKGANALSNFQANLAKQIRPASESARGASLNALVQARNAALDTGVRANAPVLTLGYVATPKISFGAANIEDNRLMSDSIQRNVRSVSFDRGGFVSGDVESIKAELRLPQSVKGKVEAEYGTSASYGRGYGVSELQGEATKQPNPFIDKLRTNLDLETPIGYRNDNKINYQDASEYVTEKTNIMNLQNIINYTGMFNVDTKPNIRISLGGITGGGGALGDKLPTASELGKRAKQKVGKFLIVPKADPFTQVVSQLRTGRSPVIIPTPRIRQAFKQEVLSNPLLTRFGGRT
jgi:hypothetical protein